MSARQINLDGSFTFPACKHRARTKDALRTPDGRFIQTETCRCGASRTRALQLGGGYDVSDWTPSPR